MIDPACAGKAMWRPELFPAEFLSNPDQALLNELIKVFGNTRRLPEVVTKLCRKVEHNFKSEQCKVKEQACKTTTAI